MALKELFIFLKTQTDIAISKKTPYPVVVDWVTTLNAMKEDGTFRRIFRRWYPEEKLPGPALLPEK